MGTFIKAQYAYMIPTLNGVVLEDNPNEPGGAPIYQIDVDAVKDFKARFDMGGVVFMPLYSGVEKYPTPHVETQKKKNEGSK